MVVTKLLLCSKKRYQVWLDGEAAFVLYKGELRRYNIEEGKELDEAVYKEIQNDVLKSRAEKRALYLLEKRDYTVAGLKRKLLDGGYSEELAQSAVEKMLAYHYLDDARYAEQYLSCYADKKTKQAICRKLLEKGIPKEVVEEAYTKFIAEGHEINEEEMALRLLKKRHYEGEPIDRKDLERHIAFLARRGFSLSCIQKAVTELQKSYHDNIMTYEEDSLDIIYENR